MPDQKLLVRHTFLTSFVRALVTAYALKNQVRREFPHEQSRVEHATLFKTIPQVQTQTSVPVQTRKVPVTQELSALQKQQLITSRREGQPQRIQRPLPFTQFQQAPPQPPRTPAMPLLSLRKLQPFIIDPSVRSIECPGPGKPLLVMRNGRAQVVSILLTQEEITEILKEMSQKTRIPLLPGLFKTAWGSLLLTAVVSEFVGTRFIIEKKH